MASPSPTDKPASSRPIAISCERLRAAYGERVILHDVSFSLHEGEILVVLGGSGCGKSTLLRCLIGLHRPASGTASLLGKDIAQISDREFDLLRRRIGVSFQGAALLNSLTIGENVSLPLREHTRLDPATIRIMTRLKLEAVGLSGTEDLVPSALSGGMRKRAGMARALAMDPKILFLDEPSAGLDPITAAGLDELLLKIRTAFGLAIVVVTHEIASAFLLADRLLMLHQGIVRFLGTPAEFRESKDPHVRQFLERRPDVQQNQGDSLIRELTR